MIFKIFFSNFPIFNWKFSFLLYYHFSLYFLSIFKSNIVKIFIFLMVLNRIQTRSTEWMFSTENFMCHLSFVNHLVVEVSTPNCAEKLSTLHFVISCMSVSFSLFFLLIAHATQCERCVALIRAAKNLQRHW